MPVLLHFFFLLFGFTTSYHFQRYRRMDYRNRQGSNMHGHLSSSGRYHALPNNHYQQNLGNGVNQNCVLQYHAPPNNPSQQYFGYGVNQNCVPQYHAQPNNRSRHSLSHGIATNQSNLPIPSRKVRIVCC